jgi:uncharacterized membrane protein YdfJ with MMPL/SSD domain
VEPISAEGRALVRAIRAVDPPVEVAVGGEAARFTDNTDHVVDRLPLVLAFMIGVVALLLAVLFRSVVVVAKAIAPNLLSLSVMFGSIVWIVVVRCLLVPSLMALAGRWNWWPSRTSASASASAPGSREAAPAPLSRPRAGSGEPADEILVTLVPTGSGGSS